MTVSRKMTKILTCKAKRAITQCLNDPLKCLSNLLEQIFFFATYLAFSVSLNQCLSRRYTAVSTLRRLFAPYIGTTLWMAFTLSENPFLKKQRRRNPLYTSKMHTKSFMSLMTYSSSVE